MATTRFQRGTFRFRFFTFIFLLCVSASLRFNTAQAQLAPATEAKIRALLASPKLKEAHVGLSILDLGTVPNPNAFPARTPIGKPFRVVFEQDAQKKFMPASNMKLFTAAIALELLGKDKTFPTQILQEGEHLRLYGGGDPSLSVANIENLAQQIADKKQNLNATIAGDGSAFTAETSKGRYPFGWTLDDTRWYYGPEISALAIERNQVDLVVAGGAQVGASAQVKFDSSMSSVLGLAAIVETGASELALRPEEDLIGFDWREQTIFYGSSVVAGYTLPTSSRLVRESLSVAGQVAPQQKVVLGVALQNPPKVAADILRAAKVKNDVAYLTKNGMTHYYPKLPTPELQILSQHNSPPLYFLFQRLLKNSDNLYAEMLLRDAAYYHDGTGGDKAGPRAHALLKSWLIAQNIDTSGLRFEDGSGLSRYNLLTPRATAELLAAINRMKDGDVIWNALPIAGVDGTLKKRMTSTPERKNSATGNVRAKSGTFSIASNLSGYVTTKSKRRLAVSLMMNFARDTETAQKMQDEIFEVLANSN